MCVCAGVCGGGGGGGEGGEGEEEGGGVVRGKEEVWYGCLDLPHSYIWPLRKKKKK